MSDPCPRCQAPLGLHETKGVELGGCTECGGVWVSTASLARITSSLKEHKALEVADALAAKATTAPDTSETGISCPRCATPMVHLQLERVAVDRCREHGTWFDRAELGRVAAAMRDAPDRPPKQAQESSTGEIVGGLALDAAIFGLLGIFF